MKRRKRGLSILITKILIILIVFVFIGMIWWVVFNLLKGGMETTEVQQKLFREQMVIKDVELEPDNFKLTLMRLGGKINSSNVIVIKITDLDIVLVTDVSGSMCECTDRSGDCRWNQYECENTCGSVCEGGIYEAKQANIDFVEDILNQEADHRIGLVAYNKEVVGTHGFSTDVEDLTDEINSWSAVLSTCICCGINNASKMFNDPIKEKMIVLMSDGIANKECSEQGTGNAKRDAIEAASDSSDEIKIYTIGFGPGADKATLEAIANETGGAYYEAVAASNLSGVYKKIATRTISKSYAIKTYEYLSIIVYDKEGLTHRANIPFSEVPSPLETRKFTINFENLDLPLPEGSVIKRVEVYAVAKTNSGKEVYSHQLDNYDIK